MRFTVAWSDAAKDLLAEIWLKLPEGERSSFSARVDWPDKSLRENAHQKGAPIAGIATYRALTPPDSFESPTVGVAYLVTVEDRTVEVLKIYDRIVPPRRS